MPSPSGMNFLDELTSNLKRVSDLKILLSVVEHIYIYMYMFSHIFLNFQDMEDGTCATV